MLRGRGKASLDWAGSVAVRGVVARPLPSLGSRPLSPLATTTHTSTHTPPQQMLFEHWQHPTPPPHAAAGSASSSAPKPSSLAGSPHSAAPRKKATGQGAAAGGNKKGLMGHHPPRRPRSKSDPSHA